MAESYSLVCLENPLLDIQAKGTPALLQKYSLKPNDAILAEDAHIPLYDELLSSPDVHLIAGGAAQNTARGAQYLLPADSVLYIGCVGADEAASTLRKACSDAGLAVRYLVDEAEPTGRCGVVITGQDRSLVTQLGAANAYKVSHLQSAEVWGLVQKADVFFVGGYHLTVSPEAALALGEYAARENKIYILSLSAPFICDFFKDPLDKTEPYWDYVLGNETEARAWAKGHGVGSDDVKEIAAAMAKRPGKANSKRERVVVITQGTEPTVVASVSGGVKEFAVGKVAEGDICDTNGAGDAFAGGFVAGVVEGRSVEESVERGHWLAGLSIRELGPSYPTPKREYKA